MKLQEKLVAIQSELKAPKNQFNSFGKYNYRSCEDILEAVKPILAKYGCFMVICDEIVEVGGRIYVKATAVIHDGEESISASAYAREAETKAGMDVSQITGSSSSYARKYALNGLFLIDDTKDADATNTHGKEEKKEEKKPLRATERQIELIKKLVPESDRPKMFKWANVEKIEDMTAEQASEIITKKTKKGESDGRN